MSARGKISDIVIEHICIRKSYSIISSLQPLVKLLGLSVEAAEDNQRRNEEHKSPHQVQNNWNIPQKITRPKKIVFS